ncbi:MAG TPA: LamG-like jellyroll fold domain-containing protein [Candidatus Binatia bacterium]|jgi:alpha-N-arabinofuranosidase|nr:LamG-like jellyroll fold domain-containing protein [Candidatus Binatia bacterium]
MSTGIKSEYFELLPVWKAHGGRNPVLRRVARLFVLLVLGTGLRLSTVHAAVTNVVWYRLGETDAGAAPGAVATNTDDLIGTRNLRAAGTPFYTNGVSASASSHVGSSLAVQFSGAGQYFTNTAIGLTNNFCFEAWVRPDSVTRNQIIAYNGDASADGWGIYQNGTNYLAVFGGVGLFGGGTATAGTWTHLALARESGQANLFVNGIASAHPTNSILLPVVKGDWFAIGANGGPPANLVFSGAIDEVRVFTFGTGQFATSQLLVNLQRVTTQAASDLTSTSATLEGSANPCALSSSGWFEWGPTTSYGNTTAAQPLGNGTSPTNFSAALTGLLSGVTYQFHAVVSNALGISYGANAAIPVPPPPTVTNTGDSGPGSLRQVISDAAPGSSIFFAPGVVGIIALSNGPLVIDKPLSIVGPGPKVLSLSGSGTTVLDLTNGDVSVSGLTFVNSGGGSTSPVINNSVNLMLNNCSFIDCPGICVMHNSNNLALLNSSFILNGEGLGIAPGATAAVTNCTFGDNAAFNGGAISNAGTLFLIDCTVAFNVAYNSAGGIYSTGTTYVGNSVVAENSTYPGGVYVAQDLAGAFISLGYNFIGAGDGSTGFTNGINQDQLGTSASPLNPLLNGQLSLYNGGPTFTFMPGITSPLIDRGKSFGATTDQRGYLRTVDFAEFPNAPGGDGTDIGAVEIGSSYPCTSNCATVTVDTSRTLRTEDERWFGANTAVWNNSLDTAATVSFMGEMGCRTLRYPGGSLADAYHWSSNYWIGNRTGPTPFTNFMHLATNAGANVFITVNYGSGSAAEAADWVRCANVTNHCGFKYWEVGNECYSSTEMDINTNAPYQAQDPWTYAMRFRDYYNAMKAVDPTIKIGAVVLPGEDTLSLYKGHNAYNPRTGLFHDGWAPVLLSTFATNGVLPDFLIHHFYPESGLESDSLLLQAPANWANDAADLRQEITDYIGSAGTNIELLCTENNSDASYSQGRQSTSLVNGLYLADSLAQIMKTEFGSWLWWLYESGADKKGSFSSSLYGWRTNGDFGLVLNSTTRYPTFYAFKLMHYFTQPGDTILDVTSSNPFLAVYASQRTNGTLNLLVINKDRTNTANQTINVAGFSPDSIALLRSYGIPQDEAARTNAPVAMQDIATNQLVISRGSFTSSFGPYSMTLFSLTPTGPTLTVSRPVNNVLVISWPYPSTGWNLKQNSDLATGNWAPSSAIVQNDGTNNFITISPPTGNLFFRLTNQ